MTIQEFPMTRAGLEKLKREQTELEGSKSTKATERIKYARSFCDFQEDSEYEAALKERAAIDNRIAKLKQMIQYAKVIDQTSQQSVTIGSIVSIKEFKTDSIETYMIVGPEEIDINEGKISYLAPIAKQLLNTKVGDEIVIKTPNGEQKIEVMQIM